MNAARAVDGRSTRAVASSLGLVVAGVALAACLLPWTDRAPLVAVDAVAGSAVGGVLAAVALLAFAGRRHGALDRRPGGVVAGLAALALVAVGLLRLLTPALGGGTAPTIEQVAVGPVPLYGLPLATLAGLLAGSLALADVLGLPDAAVVAKLRATTAAAGIGLVAFVASTAVALLPALAARPYGTTVAVAALTVGSGLGLALFAFGYVRYRGLPLEYVDVRWPDRWAVAAGLGGLVLLFVAAAAVSLGFERLGLATAESSIEELATRFEDPEFLLVLVPLSFLVIGPGEELVYRNVVQKYLYEAFSRRTAVVVASVVFGAVHFQQYADPNPVATLSTLFLVFVLSLVLGYTYYRTENLLVPIFVHGAFNAIQFALLYARLTADLPVAGA